MTCNPHLVGGHGYIIFIIDYFTKWAKAMPTFNNTIEKVAYFFFNHMISRFGVLQEVVIDHGKHFQNHIITELASKFVLSHETSAPYYPQADKQVEVINKVLRLCFNV